MSSEVAPRSTACDGLHCAGSGGSDWAAGWLLSVLSVHVPLITVVAATAPLTTDGAAAGMEVALPMTTTLAVTVAAAAEGKGKGAGGVNNGQQRSGSSGSDSQRHAQK